MSGKNKSIVLNLLGIMLVGVVFAAGYVTSSTHNVPEGGYNGHLGTLPPGYDKPRNMPTWDSVPPAERHGCRPVPKHIGELPPVVIAIDQSPESNVVRMTFREALYRNTTATWADDVWVVGICEQESRL